MNALRIITKAAAGLAAGIALTVASVAIPGTAQAVTMACSSNVYPNAAHLPGFSYKACTVRDSTYYAHERVQVTNTSANKSYYVSKYYAKINIGNGGVVNCSGGWVGPGQSFYCESLSMYQQFGGLAAGVGAITYWDPVYGAYYESAATSPYA